MDEEKAYWTHEISSVLGVSDGTLRKWCLALEKHGYLFTRGVNNSRAFLVRDKKALLYLKRLVQVDKLTIEKASYQVFIEYRANERTTPVRVDQQVVRESFEQELKNINKRLDQQEAINKEILNRMEEQEQRQKERDKNLMISLNQSLETQKQIAAAKEKKWWQFWK